MLDLGDELTRKIADYLPDFEAIGVLTRGDSIYPLGSDTKVLSTIFELAVRPLVFAIAADHGYQVHEPEQQNFYPDFTLMKDRNDPEKVAIDVKTTYRSWRTNGTWTAKFTLGSYTSFFRDDTKNIVFPYSQYANHFIIGFIYTRADSVFNNRHVYNLEERDTIYSPIADVEFFVQEKYRIAGTQPGSGNTTNIGSIVGKSVVDFVEGKGPFASGGEALFLDYWRNYGRTSAERSYSNMSGYLLWKEGNASKLGRQQ